MAETTAAGPQLSKRDIINRIPGRISGGLLSVLALLILAGIAGLVIGLRSEPQRAWQVYLVNFLFFSGLAAAGVIFGAIMQVAKGHWGVPLHRIAQGFGAFLPMSYLMFLALYLGRNELFPWIENPVNFEGHPIRVAWLNTTGLFARGGIFLLLLYLGCFVFMYYSLRPDMPDAAERLQGWRRRLVNLIGRRHRGGEDEAVRSRRILGRLSPPLLLAYVIILSGMAIDLIMSLEPGWISVLFPAYFFIGAWLSALAATALMGAVLRSRMGLEFASNHWHDLGKLTFAFCVFWAYLWYSQVLVIWYGNLPRETIFVEPRTLAPWTPLTVAFFVCVFVLPFVLLLGQRVKMVPPYLGAVAGLILVGFWLERFDLVVPSIWEGGGVPLGWIELLVTLGFLGVFGLCYALYASTFPLIPLRNSIIVGKSRKGPY